MSPADGVEMAHLRRDGDAPPPISSVPQNTQAMHQPPRAAAGPDRDMTSSIARTWSDLNSLRYRDKGPSSPPSGSSGTGTGSQDDIRAQAGPSSGPYPVEYPRKARPVAADAEPPAAGDRSSPSDDASAYRIVPPGVYPGDLRTVPVAAYSRGSPAASPARPDSPAANGSCPGSPTPSSPTRVTALRPDASRDSSGTQPDPAALALPLGPMLDINAPTAARKPPEFYRQLAAAPAADPPLARQYDPARLPGTAAYGLPPPDPGPGLWQHRPEPPPGPFRSERPHPADVPWHDPMGRPPRPMYQPPMPDPLDVHLHHRRGPPVPLSPEPPLPFPPSPPSPEILALEYLADDEGFERALQGPGRTGRPPANAECQNCRAVEVVPQGWVPDFQWDLGVPRWCPGCGQVTVWVGLREVRLAPSRRPLSPTAGSRRGWGGGDTGGRRLREERPGEPRWMAGRGEESADPPPVGRPWARHGAASLRMPPEPDVPGYRGVGPERAYRDPYRAHGRGEGYRGRPGDPGYADSAEGLYRHREEPRGFPPYPEVIVEVPRGREPYSCLDRLQGTQPLLVPLAEQRGRERGGGDGAHAPGRDRAGEGGEGSGKGNAHGDECDICMDRAKDHCLDPCGHRFCQPCIKDFPHRTCPICSRPFFKSIKLF